MDKANSASSGDKSFNMPKTYLRYQESDVFGIIASLETSITYDKTGKLAIAGALESCVAWQIRGGNQVHRCKAPLLTHGQGGKALHELAASTRVLLSPDGETVASALFLETSVRLLWPKRTANRSCAFAAISVLFHRWHMIDGVY